MIEMAYRMCAHAWKKKWPTCVQCHRARRLNHFCAKKSGYDPRLAPPPQAIIHSQNTCDISLLETYNYLNFIASQLCTQKWLYSVLRL